jgi:hypothetical protein
VLPVVPVAPVTAAVIVNTLENVNEFTVYVMITEMLDDKEVPDATERTREPSAEVVAAVFVDIVTPVGSELIAAVAATRLVPT